MLINDLAKKKLISPPEWMLTNVQNLSIMGSMAYGVSDDESDYDLYGWCIPPKATIFPHLEGHITGFGQQPPAFNNWTKHHVFDSQANAGRGREYDFSIHNIINYFQLLMDNNPNIIDSLFVPANCILHSTHVSNLVRDNRQMFLHKGCWHRFKGYAYSQLHKPNIKNNKASVLREIEVSLGVPHETTLEEAESAYKKVVAFKQGPIKWYERPFIKVDKKLKDRIELWEMYVNSYRKINESKTKRFDKVKAAGQDNKFLYHVVRLMSEVEQILSEGDLDLQEKGRREHMKAVRRGEVSAADIQKWFASKEKDLESLYKSSTLPYKPDEGAIKGLLMNCLEHHFGTLDKCVNEMGRSEQALVEIKRVLERYA